MTQNIYEASKEMFDVLKQQFPNESELFNEEKLHQPLKDIKEKYELVPAFLKMKGFVKQHIDSFNYFVNHQIKDIIKSKSNNQVVCENFEEFYIKYKDIRIKPPSYDTQDGSSELYPHMCRISDITYAGDIVVDFEYKIKDSIFKKEDVPIGRMPVMLGSSVCHLSRKDKKRKDGRASEKEDDKHIQKKLAIEKKECPYDPKGYFIIKGVEKVMIIQEQVIRNRIIVEYDKKLESYIASVQSSTLETKSLTTILIKDGKLYLKLSSFKQLIPILIVFKAMGVESEQEIFQMTGTESHILQILSICLQDIVDNGIYSKSLALEYLGNRIKAYPGQQQRRTMKSCIDQARDILADILLAHIQIKNYNFYPKAIYLALMIRRLLEAKDDPTKVDDKDYYGNKRLDCSGQLMSLLFEDRFKLANSELKKELEKELGKELGKKKNIDVNTFANSLPNKMKITLQKYITDGLTNTLATGNWKLARFKMDRSGVTQILNRMTFIACLGMMTRINSQIERARKISGPRALHGSHWGLICPSDTPDGENCGLQKNLALLANVTIDQAQPELTEKNIIRIAIGLGVEDIGLMNGENIYVSRNYLVFLNGKIIGLHCRPHHFTKEFRYLRRKGIINEFVSIFIDIKRKSINIASDHGRLIRPLIIVENSIPKVEHHHIDSLKRKELTFQDFLQKGLIEYLDVNEEDNSFIALNEAEITSNTTHLEIDPYTILGCVAGLIPYPHHNQSPRNTYQCAMGKQALGAIAYNQHLRVDTLLYLMVYPQRPLVRTKSIELTNYNKLPAGHNASVAVMSYSGYDIEDAIILNKSSLDRGYGRVAVYKRTATELTKSPFGPSDVIKKPEIPRKHSHHENFKKYHALDQDGLARIGEKLSKEDIYINKRVPIITKEMEKSANLTINDVEFTDDVSKYKEKEPARVDRIILTSNKDKYMIIKAIMRQVRRPELGDKMSSRHGQKGVCGLIVNQEDMPFSETGWCPDLIMNPHGYPSRMTVGKMIELVAGKAGALTGKFKYGTAFGGDKIKDLGKILVKNGFSYSGKDVLMSGISGDYLNCYVFSGPIFYQRLKHMVADKIHARSKGQITKLTRQPTEGKAKEGGLRVGEMERDCLIGYGATNLLLERLMISSDEYSILVCDKCGMLQYKEYCQTCQTNEVYKIKIPYCCKLLFQELLAMNIKPKLKLVDI